MTAQTKVVNKLTDVGDKIILLFCAEDTKMARHYQAISGLIQGELVCDDTLP